MAQSGRVIGMSIEQALEELKKYADEFTQVGDATQAISTNKDDFLHKFAKVNQYYKYVVNNSEIRSDEWFMAVDIIEDIEWQLQAYQKRLISNQSSFEPNVYQSLMDDINATLNKIGRFNNMLNSEAMDGKKM